MKNSDWLGLNDLPLMIMKLCEMIDFQQVLYFGDGEIRSDPTFDYSFGKVE